MTDETRTAVLEPAEDDLLTLAETIEILGISKQTLYRMMERGDLRGVKVGRQWRFRKPDLTAYLERGPIAAALSTVPDDQLDAALAELDAQIARVGEQPVAASPDIADPTERKVDQLVRGLLLLAVFSKASDIHIEPRRRESMLLIRLRIDGVLHETLPLPMSLHPALTQQLKTMAGLNTDERSVPQDGRIHLHYAEGEYDLRISVIPSIFGESIVIRLLTQSDMIPVLDRLYHTPEDLARLRDWLRRPSGLILVSGPTGCGKTTVLYSCLMEITRPQIKILSIEDPVEYVLPGTVQVGVNRQAGLTFPVALRAFLRQDPDIIMIGETRDVETINLAMQAALTGHLVFTTQHAQDALAAALRLREMGIEPYLIAESLIGIGAQRLVRCICPQCRQPVHLAPDVRRHIQQLSARGGFTVTEDTTFYKGAGCAQCHNLGYRRRAAIHELIEFTPAVKEAFLRGASHDELVSVAVRDGMHTLMADGIRKASEGLTTIEEVLRVLA